MSPPDEIAEMTADEIKAYVPDFKQAVADHPVYGEAAEKLSKEELENNINWYGNMYGTAYKKITDEKFPDADQLGSEAGIASAFQNNTCAFSQVLETISYSENKINFRDVPMKEGMTKSSVSRLLNDAAMEASGNKDKGGNNFFLKASRAVKFSDLLYTVLDSDENIRTRALYKVILETEIVPDLADKDVSFEDKSLNALIIFQKQLHTSLCSSFWAKWGGSS